VNLALREIFDDIYLSVPLQVVFLDSDFVIFPFSMIAAPLVEASTRDARSPENLYATGTTVACSTEGVSALSVISLRRNGISTTSEEQRSRSFRSLGKTACEKFHPALLCRSTRRAMSSGSQAQTLRWEDARLRRSCSSRGALTSAGF